VIEPSPLYSYVRSLHLEGTFPNDVGCFIISANRIGAGWGCIDEAAWPYNSIEKQGWPPREPPGLDEMAKKHRLPFYVGARTLHECKMALNAQWLPQVAFEITGDWHCAPGGEIPTPRPGDTRIVGVHSVCLTGYDDTTARIQFVNSWGEGWGNAGFGSLDYEYFERFFRDGWLATAPCELQHQQPYASGESFLNWGLRTPVGFLHGIEVYDPSADVRRGWTFVRQGPKHLEIEELFVRPDQRGNGVAAKLCEGLQELSDIAKLPLRLWVPIVDDSSDPEGVEAVARRLGLALRESGVVWANRVGG
jgi:GNAT superfamily N-acetyltransferase